MVDVKNLRAELVRIARGRDAGHRAEDLAQDALAAAHKKAPRNVGEYARATLMKLLLKERRTRKSRPADVFDPNAQGEALDVGLLHVEKLVHADAALEQLILWGNEGTTRRIIGSLAEVNVPSIERRVGFYAALVYLLPLSARHINRVAKDLSEKIDAARPRSGWVYEEVLERRHAKISPVMEKEAEAVKRGPSHGERVTLVIKGEPMVNRAVFLIGKLCPSISAEKSHQIACEAYSLAYPERVEAGLEAAAGT